MLLKVTFNVAKRDRGNMLRGCLWVIVFSEEGCLTCLVSSSTVCICGCGCGCESSRLLVVFCDGFNG